MRIRSARRLPARLPALLLASVLALALVGPAGAEEPAVPTRRFALVVGQNRGGDKNVRLRYATSDARSFGDLLVELGGVRPDDLVLLLDQGLPAFRDATERLRVQAAAAEASGQRCELMLYYSGHSDEEGLLFGRDKLPYADLRASIERVPAAVRVAILDSCSSGSMTRAKGGVSKPAFLFDASSDMTGHAYITSSSAAEAAQESDKLGGSFFTHHLVSALRGAADVRGQGKVTLNDAYAYAFRETLASTEKTQYGPQHPAYEISLTGTGDLVFTDLRSSRAGLLLADELDGAIYVRDAKGELAVELDKEAGGRMEIGLPQGKYTVALVKDESRRQASVVVPASGRAFLSSGDFRQQTAAERTTTRGLVVTSPSEVDSRSERLVYRTSIPGFPVSFDAKLMPNFSNGIFSSEEDKDVSVSALWGQARDVRFQFATLASADSGNLDGVQIALLANAVKGTARGAQLSYLGNAALDGFNGLQTCSVLNFAKGESRGVQLGMVNVAGHIRGVQVGLVNVAERIDGVPVGLVNIEKGGIRSAECWMEGPSSVRAGFAFGTRIVYTLVQGGMSFGDGKAEEPLVGLGLGGRITLSPFYMDIDASWRSYLESKDDDVEQSSATICLRAVAGFRAKGLGVFGGVALEGLVPDISRDAEDLEAEEFDARPTFIFGVKL
jgi:hypothetical protein